MSSQQQQQQHYQRHPQQTDNNHHNQHYNSDDFGARNSVSHFGHVDAQQDHNQQQQYNSRKRRTPASGDDDENDAYIDYQNQYPGRELTEERTCHSFKRLRLQSSEESSQSESANENANNGCRQQWSNVERGVARPVYAQCHDQQHQQHLLPQHSQPQLQQHYAYNHPQQQEQQQQHAGQPTNAELRNACNADKDYSEVNNFLGLMHQQRQQRIHRTAPTVATSEWEVGGKCHSESAQQQHQRNAMGMSGNHQHQFAHKHHGRYSVHLPSNSNIM